MSDEMGFVLLIVGFVLLIGLCMGVSSATEYIKCGRKYESFENRYALLQGCQIKVKGKWIPVDSYYFKEE